MKLVELLARELKAWPEGYTGCITQDCDREFRFEGSTEYDFYATQTASDVGPGFGPKNGAAVTRAEWEAERAKITTPAARIDPIAWRNRIHAIDAEVHELNTTHTAAVEAREEERIALVQRLELEGLQLIAAK